MTPQRIIVRGATTAVTRRCVLRKGFLAPWHPEVTQIRLYALAYAQHIYDVEIHHSIDVINHTHGSFTPTRDNLPEFIRQANHDTSCAINTLLAEHSYDAPGQLFDGNKPHYVRLMDASAQMSHLLYEHLNCVAAGLVERPELMPGFVLDWRLWKAGGIWVERPRPFFSINRPQWLFLRLNAPAYLYLLFGGDLDALIHHMERLSRHGTRRIREARKFPAMGARRVKAIHPWSEPNTLREDGGSRSYCFKFGDRYVDGQDLEILGALEVAGFRGEYTDVRKRRLGGDEDAIYPFATYGPRRFHNDPVETEPLVDAMVTRPGPTYAEVVAELEERGAQSRDRDEAHRVIDEVRGAFDEDVDGFVSDGPPEPPASPSPAGGGRAGEAQDASQADEASGEADGADSAAGEVHVRRRRDRKPPPRAGEARRVVVLRDRRQGRPRREDDSGNGGSDPPS